MAEPTTQEIFALAVQRQRAGHPLEAEQLCRQVLARQPAHADALHFLGVIVQQAGRQQEAAELIRRAIELQPTNADARNNLGNVLQSMGRLHEAIALYREAVRLKPELASAHCNLANALKSLGQLDDAIAAYREAIRFKPGFADAHNSLGNALRDTRQYDQAISCFREAVRIKPDYADAYCNLGIAFKASGQNDQAIAAYRRAIQLKPDFPAAHNNLGNALRDSGAFADAIASYRDAIRFRPDYIEAYSNLGNAFADAARTEEAKEILHQAIRLRPDHPEAYNNLGGVLQLSGQNDDAIRAFRRAIDLKPNHAEALSNLGAVLCEKGQFDESVAVLRRAIEIKPDLALAHGNLGVTLNHMGRISESIAALRQAVAVDGGSPDSHGKLLFILHYDPNYDASAIAEEHREWNRRYAEPLKTLIRPHANDRNPDRRLRIGYVSPDFKQHAVAPMLLPLLEHHHRANVEVFCYAQVQRPDAVTDRFRAHCDQWRSTVGLSDERMADLIREDQIDILVDLAGHTAGGRLMVFARKPAPVQVTRQGYPNTTGLTAMDYRMTDALADPPDLSDTLHCEKLIRLPRTNWIYQPPESSPAPDHRISEESVTFGCFNNFTKVTEPMMVVWSRILKDVPRSRLLLKSKALGNPSTRERVRELFINQGIDPARLDIRGHEPEHGGHLAQYNQMDIGLDPFPYHGTTTTCEALWMGVPVVTLAGQTHVSRVGVSLLTNVGLTELISESAEAYIRIAVDLANDLPRLRMLHSTIRQRLERSPVMDASGFARNTEAAYREIWRIWCGSESIGR